jgi:tartrate dehydratase alpha subunit/fumarate hydratase class I-like protein
VGASPSPLTGMTYRLRDAPAELRLKIFGTTSTLALGPGFACPPLLLALGILKGTDDEVVYTEAKEVSRKVNHVVTVKNQAAFCRIDRIVLSKINYLTLFVGGDRYAVLYSMVR